MTRPTSLPRRPLPRQIRRDRRTVRRSDVMTVMEHYTHTPGVWAVELVLVAGQVARMVVHRESGEKEELTVMEDEG